MPCCSEDQLVIIRVDPECSVKWTPKNELLALEVSICINKPLNHFGSICHGNWLQTVSKLWLNESRVFCAVFQLSQFEH